MQLITPASTKPSFGCPPRFGARKVETFGTNRTDADAKIAARAKKAELEKTHYAVVCRKGDPEQPSNPREGHIEWYVAWDDTKLR
jgi:hypothetical protein